MKKHRTRTAPSPPPPLCDRAVVYARVSSREQLEEGWSTDAQIRKLRDYCAERGLSVATEFEEAISAKEGGRPAFDAMLDFVRSNPGVVIVVEKVDRLVRNYPDWVRIGELGRPIHFVNEALVYSSDSSSKDKFLVDIRMVLAKNYSENLSEEIRKGMREKALQGHYPTHAPVGYLNVRVDGRSTLQIDPKRGHLVRRLYEAYATGLHSVTTIAEMGKSIGLTTKKGNAVCRGTISDILRNPLFAGRYCWGGQEFEGVHDPIVDEETWATVQRILDGRRTVRGGFGVLPFAYRGLLNCSCGLLMTGEVKKGRYTYYHCTGRNPGCDHPFVREELITAAFQEMLGRLVMPDDVLDWLRQALLTDHEDRMMYQRRQEERVEAELADARRRLERLYEDMVSGRINQDVYDSLRKTGEVQLRKARQTLASFAKAESSAFQTGFELLQVVQTAQERFAGASADDKRLIVRSLCSNCVWDHGTLVPTLRKPYDLMLNAAQIERADGPASNGDGEVREVWWR